MSSNKMFMPIKFNTTVQILPKELKNNFEKVIIEKLKNNLENVCSKHGYIKQNSIKIIKRSAGYFKESHFNANIAFDLNCIAEICNPAQDSIINCVVRAKNNLGLRAEGIYDNNAILEVIIPKITSGIQSDVNIDTINVGDEVKVQVCGKKFTLYDKSISIIGKIIKDKEENIVVVEPIDEDDIIIDDDNEIEDILIETSEILNDDDDDDDIKKIELAEPIENVKLGGDMDDEEDDDDNDNDDDNDYDELEDDDYNSEDDFDNIIEGDDF